MVDPKIRQFTVLCSMPSELRRGARSVWSRYALDGRKLDGFLEGPVMGPDGTLYMTDIPFGRILSFAPTGSWSVVAEYDGWPNGMKLSDAGFLVADHKRGLLEIGREGSVRVIVDGFEGAPFHGLNDLTVAHNGDIWFTDQGMSGLDAPFGRLFRYSNGLLTMAMGGIPSPNGLVFSEDETVIYLAVTRDNAIWRLPLGEDGNIRKAGRFIQLSGGVGPDGLARGPDGDLMVVHAGLGVWRFGANGLPRTFWHDPDFTYPTNLAADPRKPGWYLVTESLTCSVLCVGLTDGEAG